MDCLTGNVSFSDREKYSWSSRTGFIDPSYNKMKNDHTSVGYS